MSGGCGTWAHTQVPDVAVADSVGESPVDSGAVKASARDSLVRECDQQTTWCDFVQEAARDSWLYAQMAENAYGRETFRLPANIRRDTVIEYAGTDFSATVYSQWNGSKRQAVIIAYRGTDFTHWRDWAFGNLFTFQNRQALRLFDRVRDLYPDVPFVVTGHSLGGAMAMYVSLRREGAEAYVFNTSPHYRTPLWGRADNERTSVASYAEILKGLRVFSHRGLTTHTVAPCANGGTFNRHTQRLLANCLTQVAALTSPEAAASLTLNNLPPRPAPVPYPADTP